jgi:hypothetical protein
MYRENNKKSVVDWNKPLFEHKHTSLEKVLANANKATESNQVPKQNQIKTVVLYK